MTMTDWSSELSAALASGSPEFMKAMLARVPEEILRQAAPYLCQQARASEQGGRLDEALAYYDHLLRAVPTHVESHAQRARLLLRLERYGEALASAETIAELAPDSSLSHRLQAQACEGLGEAPQVLAALQRALALEPEDEVLRERVRSLEISRRKEAVLRQALTPDAPQEALSIDLPPPPEVVFGPLLLEDPSIPSSWDDFRIEGLKQHLWRYSGQLSPRNAISRLEDPAWLAAWDEALAATTDARLLFRGSELGVFALRALYHGAAHAFCVEAFPLDARIAAGMAQKYFLAPWHEQHGTAIQGWSEEERRASFEEFAGDIDIVAADSQLPKDVSWDCLVFPQIDHSLLGTGIAMAVRQFCAGRAAPLRVLPARARVYAMAIQWTYPCGNFRLEPMNALRWSMYPQALDLGPEFWIALTEPVQVGDIDFACFAEASWDIALPATSDGTVDGIIYWFELDLGTTWISNAPGGELRCIKPAVQYTDPIEVLSGGVVELRIRVEESRLSFQTLPPAALLRTRGLPDWYVPMLGDVNRNRAYHAAVSRTLAAKPAPLVLDIGAGCGLLSMMAAQAGAESVVGCEIQAAIVQAGREITALNGMAERVTLVEKDCRHMKVPEDLPRQADLALFELFDCSLIGEGILHFLAHAREHLLAENARYLPAAARIRAMVIESRLERIWNIDANLLNPYRATPGFINVDATKLAYCPLTDPFDVFAFDFASASPVPDERALCLPAIASGMAGAVLFWFDLELDETCWISNDPQGENAFHWKQGLQFLPEVHVEAGGQLPLVAGHDGSSLRFRWQPEALPAEAFAKVPRFDPRWLAASSELEQQTQGLLQHCTQNPDEYAKVVEIAQRFAIDPATHGLDPAIAQRFALMFFST